MNQAIRIVDPWTYIHALQGGVVTDWESVPDFEPLDATRLDHLQLAFIFPEPNQTRWQGLRKPRPKGTPMTRVGENGHMDSDGVEYEAAPSLIEEDKQGNLRIKQMPWRRTSDKRETSSMIRRAMREIEAEERGRLWRRAIIDGHYKPHYT